MPEATPGWLPADVGAAHAGAEGVGVAAMGRRDAKQQGCLCHLRVPSTSPGPAARAQTLNVTQADRAQAHSGALQLGIKSVSKITAFFFKSLGKNKAN